MGYTAFHMLWLGFLVEQAEGYFQQCQGFEKISLLVQDHHTTPRLQGPCLGPN